MTKTFVTEPVVLWGTLKIYRGVPPARADAVMPEEDLLMAVEEWNPEGLARSMKKGPTTLGNLGRFTIRRELIEEEPELVLEMLKGCIPVRVELMFANNAVEYLAFSQAFAPVPHGQEAPVYHARVEHRWTDEDGEPSIRPRFMGWE